MKLHGLLVRLTKKNKTMTKNFVMAIVLLGVATVASAKGTNESDFAVVKSQAKESVFKVMYQGDEKSTVKISIKNDQGELIFKELIKDTDGFTRPYNFSSLPQGNYSVTIDNGVSVRTEIISHEEVNSKKSVRISAVDTERNKVALTVYSLRKGEVIIKVLNEAKETVFEESQFVQGGFGRLYNLKDLAHYTIEVHDASGLIGSKSI